MEEENLRLSVLMVDDEPINLKLLGGLLRPLDLDLHFAEDGDQALELLQTRQFDLLLFDIMMPGVDGLELCRRARRDQRHQNVPILILTSMAARETLMQAFEAGASDFLTKPFHGPELIHRVQAQVKTRRLQQALERSRRELAEAHNALAESSHRDRLTGLWDRTKALDLMEYEAERSDRQSRPIGVALLEIDHFQATLDVFGRDEGDRVLKLAAEVLLSKLRKGDILARWDHEGFLLVFPETGVSGALHAVHKMRKALEKGSWNLRDGRTLTFSAGVTAKAPGEGWDVCLQLAAQALSRAQSQGGNHVEVPR